MNNLRNSVRLVGRAGMDPEVMNFDNGSKKVKFSLATSEYRKDAKGNKIEETQWHNIIAWGPLASILEKYLQKGKEVAVEGKLVYRSFETKDGQRKYITEVVANETLFLGNDKAAAAK